jgi:transcription initiation factor TFIID subunit TAF12
MQSEHNVVSRKSLQTLYPPDTEVEASAEELLLTVGNEFFACVADLAASAAAARGDQTLQVEDVRQALERHFQIRLPETLSHGNVASLSKVSQTKLRRDGQVKKYYNTRSK